MSAKTARAPAQDVECVTELERASVLLQPIRLEILRRARDRVSASEIADGLGLPRQKVNYHVRELYKAGYLKRAGTRRKRNLIERLFTATARSYLLAPQVLGPTAPDWRSVDDALSAAHLLALTSQIQAEVAVASREAAAEGKRLATLSLHATLRFANAGQRAAFTEALQEAVADVVQRFSAPFRQQDGSPGDGRPYRLTVACHPIPPGGEPPSSERSTDDERREDEEMDR